jgi:DNA ligase-4
MKRFVLYDRQAIEQAPLSADKIEYTLYRVASANPFSSREIKISKHGRKIDPAEEIALRRSGRFAFCSNTCVPPRFPEKVTLNCFHFLLSDILKVRSSLPAALELMMQADQIRRMPVSPAQREQRTLKESILAEVKPQVGIMISQPRYDKARSIKYCCHLVGFNDVSVERKYDGEYYQIHVNKDHTTHRIKIFSKSGRDSTADRVALHSTLVKCLGLDASLSKFNRQCILEGVLLVWSDRTQKILPFYKIRKYVQREGRYLGGAQGSPVSEDEHLMILLCTG